MTVAVKESEHITHETPGIDAGNFKELEELTKPNIRNKEGNLCSILGWSDGKLTAQNYVGILQTRGGIVLEILPKVDLVDDDENHTKTREVFMQMLRVWQDGTRKQFDPTGIRAMHRFNMLEVFVHLFLQNLIKLTQRGLAKHYQPIEENLPCLRGRILFPQHLRTNNANRARFYVRYDEFNANRPANRLIHSAITKLTPMTRHPPNQQRLHQLKISFSDIPVSINLPGDWQAHRIDRSMRHYQDVMAWTKLFLFGHGLTTFSGENINYSLLFPMEQVFEKFVAHSFKTHSHSFTVKTQIMKEHLVINKLDNGEDKKMFYMQPDILLTRGDTKYILDTKWKRIDQRKINKNYKISQSDMYQLYAYGKKYDCKTIALIYPETAQFKTPIKFTYDPTLTLLCLPFNVADPKSSVTNIIDHLSSPPL